MSKYSEMFSSFQRQGAFPIEANYIFPTEAALKEFYSNEVNKATLHKGLLKIVENDEDNKQALYWVTQDKDTGELKFTKLAIEVNDIFEGLDELQKKLDQEIADRKQGDQSLWGTTDPSAIPEDLNSITDLSIAVTTLKDELHNLIDELEKVYYNPLKRDIKAIAGTEENNVIEYLKTLKYGDLTTISELLDKFLNQVDESSEYIGTFKELQNFLDGYKDSDRLRTILDNLEDKIIPLATWVKNRTDNLQTELDQTQVGVGLSGDGSFQPDEETNYLTPATSVMHALRILDHYIKDNIDGLQEINDKLGKPNGIATLDEEGKVPAEQLPDLVHDVIFVFALYKRDAVGKLYDIQLYTDVELQERVIPEYDKIYQDITAEPYYQFKWENKWVHIHSGCLILGEIDGTAYEGSKGKEVTDRVDRLTGNDIEIVSEMTNTPDEDSIEVELSFENYNIAESGEVTHTSDTVKTTLPSATQSKAGLLSSVDKTELDRVNTANFELGEVTPTATNVEIAANKTNISDNSSVENNITINSATDKAAGVMSALDKKNLDRIISDTYPIKITSFTNDLNLKEVGSNNTGVFNWQYANLDFHPIKSHKINDTNISDLEARTYTIENITSSTHQTLNYELTITTTDGKTASKTTSIQFNHATYVGAVKTFSESEISKLTKSIERGRNTTKKVVQDDSKLVYCYPSYFGDLTSIKNSSGFEGIQGYDKSQITVGTQQYTVYVQKIAATATDTYTFT